MDSRRGMGRRAEDAVAGMLAARGRVLARNWRPRGGGEVDIVAREGEDLLFVEVKARRLGRPRTLVTAKQRGRLLRSVDLWLARHPHEGPVLLMMGRVTLDFHGQVSSIAMVPLA